MAARDRKVLDSYAGRVQHGRELRDVFSRVNQARWRPTLRTRSVQQLLQQAEQGRVRELLAVKRERMSASPFAFYRGSVPLMAADLAACGSTGFVTHIYGDAHVRNLGAFAVFDDRLTFDVNDFDETCVAPWEWDVKRLASSLILAGREAGIPERDCGDAALLFGRTYRNHIVEISRMPYLQLARDHVHRHMAAQPVTDALRTAERATPQAVLEKLTTGTRAGIEFRDEPPLLRRATSAERKSVLAGLQKYRASLTSKSLHTFNRYTVTDVAFKVVGIGSVGMRDYLVLMFGNDGVDPLILQLKQELPSAYGPLVAARKGSHEGARVVGGQSLLQTQSDLLLGWSSMGGRHYLVRQFSDHKGTPNPADFANGGLQHFAVVCGEIIARGHARGCDAAVLAGYMGRSDRFERAISDFSRAYADQTERDHREFCSAFRLKPAAAK